MSTSTSAASSAPSSTSSTSTEEDKDGLALSFNPAQRLHSFLAPTVWHHMTPLAQKYKAVNLGQGFPGFSPPQFVKDALSAATLEQNGLDFMANQYARAAGNLQLVNVLAERYSKLLSRTVDPINEVMVCNGATGVIFNATQSFLNPGDEVVAFEPTFDIYLAQSQMCGASLKSVPLYLQGEGAKREWVFDEEVFAQQFNDKTRMLILNTPHNPTGKVFTRKELDFIASIVRKYPNVVVIADEVYEHLVFEGEHINFASLPEMWDRTMTVSSAGKTFSCTGWKIGWAVGPAHLIRAMGVTGSWVSFSVNTPSQVAIANALKQAEQPYESHESYYAALRAAYLKKRTMLVDCLLSAGLSPIVPQGSFFVMADTSNIAIPDKWLEEYKHESRDWAFARWLTTEIGVACIPPSPFYCDENKPLAHNLVRFAFAQSDEVLAKACEKLLQLKQFNKQ